MLHISIYIYIYLIYISVFLSTKHNSFICLLMNTELAFLG